MATAVIDHIAHHGWHVKFSGESYRVRHTLMQEGQPLKKRACFRCSDYSISDALFAQVLLTKHSAHGGERLQDAQSALYLPASPLLHPDAFHRCALVPLAAKSWSFAPSDAEAPGTSSAIDPSAVSRA